MQGKVKRNYLTYVHVVIMFFIMVGVGMLPTFGQVTPLGMKVLGVFLATLYGWLFLDLLWPSLIGLVALGLTGYTTIGEAFASALSTATGIQVIITCVFASALEKIGATEVLSNWILTREPLRKNPWLLIITLFLTIIIGTVFGAGIALVFMIWTLTIKAAEQCGYSKNDPLVAFIMTGAVIMCFAASCIIPFRGAALMYLSFYIPIGGEISYAPFIIFSSVYVACLIVAFLLTAKYIVKIDVSRFTLPDEEVMRLKNIKVTKQQKIGCGIMIAYFVVMLSPAFLPKTWAVIQLAKTMGLLGVTTVALMLLALVKDDDGKQIVKLAACHGSVPWDVVWLICATTPLANAMESTEGGLMATVSAAVTPVLAGMSPTLFLIAVVIVLGVLTQFTHNLVLGAMFIPFLTPILLEMGGNGPLLFMFCLIILNCAYVTPAASMQSAMIHGHELIGRKAAYTWGLITLVASWLILIVIGIPLGNILW